MTQSAKHFAALLQEGIAAIATRTAKPKGVIRDELGYAIGRKGGSAIEYWCYGDGHIPSQQTEVEALARALIDAGNLDHIWLASFLESAGYPHCETLLADLFPDSPDQPSHNLPLPPTSFVGRDRELADLAELIADPQCRLITLVGPGGSGKTRLAVEAARNAHNAFTDGTVFVTLAPLLSADLVVPTVAAALHLTLEAHATPQTQLLHYLRRKALLLVLDNFEHLLSPLSSSQTATAENPAIRLLTEILQQAPAVTMVVTSRERLNLQGEWVYDVDGLEMPTEDSATPLEGYSAPALFLQTARRVQASFAPTATDEAAILRICQLVEGMPLALELAAAWVRVLSCRKIAEEIEASLGFLTTTLRDLPHRHRSMRAVFDHSWKLLSAAEQCVFARCSVFRGGFTREAATQVAGATLPVLAALVDKSLLSRTRQGRYEIHELAWQYAADRLVEAQQEAQTRNRHLTFFMQLSEAAAPQLRSGPQITEWHDRMEIEHDNLRAALDWSFTGGEFEPGLRIVGALWEFWMNRGHAGEGQIQAERFLVRPEAAAPTPTRAKALHTAGVCAFYQGHFLTARSWLAESIAISRALGPSGKYILALALLGLGYILTKLPDFDAKQALGREILTLGHELQDAWIKGHALQQLGSVDRARGDNASAQQRFLESFACFQADGRSIMSGIPIMAIGTMFCEQGNYVAARAYLTRSLAIFEDLDDNIRISVTLTHLGNLAMAQGNYAEAQELLAKALMLIRHAGPPRHLIQTLDVMGHLAQRQGDYVRARVLHQESLTLGFEMGQQAQSACALEAFACLAARQGQTERAAFLFGAANIHFAAMKERFDLIRPLSDPHLRAEHDRLMALSRTQLGEDAFAAAWAAGAAMDLQQAVAYALAVEQTVGAVDENICRNRFGFSPTF